MTLFEMLTGHMAAQTVHVAAELNLPDKLAAGARTVAELAEQTGTHPPSLLRLLRAMTSLGLAVETVEGEYELTELGSPLRADAPDSLRSFALLNLREEGWRSWGELLHSVRTGDPAFHKVYGMKVFEYTAANPAVGEAFNEAMAENTRRAARAVAVEYDFSRFGTLVDVGGNDGTLLAGVLAAHPGLKGVVLDTPTGCEGAPATLAAAGVADRCEVVAGDFFESVPEGGDAYLLKAVIHDWDDESCVRILKSVRAAIGQDGTLLLVEPVIPTGPGRAPTVRMVTSDLNMLLYTGGKERTDEEFRALLAAAGFELTDISEPVRPLDSRVLTARPV
jgi:hypothetical protein